MYHISEDHFIYIMCLWCPGVKDTQWL